MNEICSTAGNVALKIVDAHTNEILENLEGHNLVVAAGLLQLWSAFTGDNSYKTEFYSVRFNFSNAGAPNWEDEDIVGGWVEKTLLPATGAFVGATPEVGAGVTCYFDLLSSEGNGKTINELSLWLRRYYDDGVTPDEFFLFSRIKRANITKTTAIRLEGRWEIRSSVVVA